MLSFLSWQGTRDPVFLTGVSLSPDWPVYEDSLIKLSVYDVKDKHHQMVSSTRAIFFFVCVFSFWARSPSVYPRRGNEKSFSIALMYFSFFYNMTSMFRSLNTIHTDLSDCVLQLRAQKSSPWELKRDIYMIMTLLWIWDCFFFVSSEKMFHPSQVTHNIKHAWPLSCSLRNETEWGRGFFPSHCCMCVYIYIGF